MKRLLIIIFVLALPTFLTCQSVQYPYLRNVRIQARISQTNGTAFFHYAYQLSNGGNNESGKINRFEVDISRSQGTLELDTVGLLFKNDGFTERSFRRNFPWLAEKIVPVSFVSTPAGTWTGSFTNDLTAAFHDGVSSAIKPGDSLDGFEMMSKGLPGIRRCIISPYFDVIALFPDPTDTTITYYVPPVDSVRQAVKFRTYTIGPTAPPLNFIPTTWCDTLLSYTRQSADLGWLAPLTGLGRHRDEDCDEDERPDDGITKNIEKRLEKARKELSKGDSLKARKELEKLVKKVEKIWKRSQEQEKKHKQEKKEKRDDLIMTSEAYALLKYNTEYLIERLPEKKPKKGSKEKE